VPPKGKSNNPKGRPKGIPNKSTAEIKELAQTYSAKALETLSAIMRNSDNDAARIAAAKELLDRGYGKATQSMEHTGANGVPLPTEFVIRFIGKDDGRD
jgi:D-alanyl-D-alanine carboxypeptidase